MTPKEEAKELVMDFIKYTIADPKYKLDYCKQCALIVVNKMIKEIKEHDYCYTNNIENTRLEHWENVVKEIERL